jgi:hypothetical protein
MSSLAFDKQGKPFAWHKRTAKLRVRLFRNPVGAWHMLPGHGSTHVIVIGNVGAPAPDAFRRLHFELWERETRAVEDAGQVSFRAVIVRAGSSALEGTGPRSSSPPAVTRSQRPSAMRASRHPFTPRCFYVDRV